MIKIVGIIVAVLYIIYFFWISKNDPEKANKELDEWNKARTYRRLRELEERKWEDDK